MKKLTHSLAALFALLILTLPGLAAAQTGWSYIILSPYYTVPGQSFTVSGDGFVAGEKVTVTALGSSSTATADDSGRFTTSPIVVPYSAAMSSVSVTARGSQGSGGSATLAVGGYYPTVEPSSYYVVPGNTVRFSGARFAPGESVRVTRDGTDIGSVAANESGAFTSSWYPVGYAAGRQTYTFTGAKSGAAVSRAIFVSGAPPYIILNDYYDYPGASLRVTGRAFGSNEQVKVSFGNAAIGTTTTDGAGSFTLSVAVPAGAVGGANVITATGERTGAVARTTFTVAVWRGALKSVRNIFGALF